MCMKFEMPTECQEDFWEWCRDNGIEVGNEAETGPWWACWSSAVASYASLSPGG